MSTVNKLFPEPEAQKLEVALNDLVNAFNHKRNSILAQYKVGNSEVEIVRYLTENEGKKMKEVGKYFNIKLSTLTSTIDKLEKNRLVKRKNSKEDRRVIYIQPTAKGQKLLEELLLISRDVSERMAADFMPHDFASLIKGMEKLRNSLR